MEFLKHRPRHAKRIKAAAQWRWGKVLPLNVDYGLPVAAATMAVLIFVGYWKQTRAGAVSDREFAFRLAALVLLALEFKAAELLASLSRVDWTAYASWSGAEAVLGPLGVTLAVFAGWAYGANLSTIRDWDGAAWLAENVSFMQGCISALPKVSIDKGNCQVQDQEKDKDQDIVVIKNKEKKKPSTLNPQNKHKEKCKAAKKVFRMAKDIKSKKLSIKSCRRQSFSILQGMHEVEEEIAEKDQQSQQESHQSESSRKSLTASSSLDVVSFQFSQEDTASRHSVPLNRRGSGTQPTNEDEINEMPIPGGGDDVVTGTKNRQQKFKYRTIESSTSACTVEIVEQQVDNGTLGDIGPSPPCYMPEENGDTTFSGADTTPYISETSMRFSEGASLNAEEPVRLLETSDVTWNNLRGANYYCPFEMDCATDCTVIPAAKFSEDVVTPSGDLSTQNIRPTASRRPQSHSNSLVTTTEAAPGFFAGDWLFSALLLYLMYHVTEMTGNMLQFQARMLYLVLYIFANVWLHKTNIV